MKTYGVYKEEWYADSYYEALKEFTLDTLKSLYHMLQVDGGTELGHLVTGLDDDSYSEGIVTDLKDLYYECDCDRKETLKRALEDKVIRTYETYHRCLNIGSSEYCLSPEVLEKEWLGCLDIEVGNFEEN